MQRGKSIPWPTYVGMCVAMVVVCVQVRPAAAQNLVVNGGFETTGAYANATARQPVKSGNLLDNAGFETWIRPDLVRRAVRHARNVAAVKVEPGRRWPLAWVPGCAARDGHARGAVGTVAMDNRTSHSGRRSVRITNRSMTATTYVDYQPSAYGTGRPLRLLPARRYRLTWWVKGKNIHGSKANPGVMMFSYYLKGTGRQQKRVYTNKRLSAQGSFDWRRQGVVFSTGPEGGRFVTSLQLRFATGTLWYDDVSLHDLGPAAFAPGWRRNVEHGGALARIDTTTAHSGGHSLLLEQSAPIPKPPAQRLQRPGFNMQKYLRSRNMGGFVLATQNVPVTPGQSYSLRFWYRTEGLIEENRDAPKQGYAHFEVFIFWLDKNGKSVKHRPTVWILNRGRNAPDWVMSHNDRFAQAGSGNPVLCPPGAVTANLRFSLVILVPGITPKVWIDDVAFKKTD